MIYNFYDTINLILCILLTLYVSIKYNFSNKILYLLLLHLCLIAGFDFIMDYNSFPDLFRYFHSSSEFRENYSTNEISSNVYYASLMFTFFPIFIESIKSLGFANYLLYLFLFISLVQKLQTKLISHNFKLFYLIYPSLILFSSIGLRDFLIVFFMFSSLQQLIIQNKYIKSIIWALPLILIKFQNFSLITLSILFYRIMTLKNPKVKFYLIFIYVLIIIIMIYYNSDKLNLIRASFFVEDTNLPIYDMPSWSYMDIYRVLFAPFFFDARNTLQMIQSIENLFIFIVVYKIYKYAKKIQIPAIPFITINSFLIISALLYSFIIFNYGTLTRYKFPFIFCWITIMLFLIDKKLKTIEEIYVNIMD